MKIRDAKGFTLIELMIMLSIVLILVVIAIPNYFSSIARSEQTEAKSSLAEIYVKMMSFEPLSAVDGFSGISSLVGDIGFNPPENARYNYQIVSVGINNFRVRAEGVSGRVLGDVWEVTEAQKVPFDLVTTRFDQ